MSVPRRILVPTDFGETSNAAIRYGLDLARALSGEVIVMHTFEIPILGFPDGQLVASAEITSRILEAAQSGLNAQVAAHAEEGVAIRSVLKQGPTAQTISDTAVELEADLVVMATHGRHGIARALLGSVTEKVVRMSSVPVLTVHAQSLATAENARAVRDKTEASRDGMARPH